MVWVWIFRETVLPLWVLGKWCCRLFRWRWRGRAVPSGRGGLAEFGFSGIWINGLWKPALSFGTSLLLSDCYLNSIQDISQSQIQCILQSDHLWIPSLGLACRMINPGCIGTKISFQEVMGGSFDLFLYHNWGFLKLCSDSFLYSSLQTIVSYLF